MLQVLRDAHIDAVLSFGLPAPSDGCGCILSHLLKVPLVDVNGNPMITSPPNTPQVFGSMILAVRQARLGCVSQRTGCSKESQRLTLSWARLGCVSQRTGCSKESQRLTLSWARLGC